MTFDGVQTETHRDHREMGTTRAAPGIELIREMRNPAALKGRHIFRAEGFR